MRVSLGQAPGVGWTRRVSWRRSRLAGPPTVGDVDERDRAPPSICCDLRDAFVALGFLLAASRRCRSVLTAAAAVDIAAWWARPLQYPAAGADRQQRQVSSCRLYLPVPRKMIDDAHQSTLPQDIFRGLAWPLSDSPRARGWRLGLGAAGKRIVAASVRTRAR